MMDDWKLPWEGGCRCGNVRLRVTAPPLLAMACPRRPSVEHESVSAGSSDPTLSDIAR